MEIKMITRIKNGRLILPDGIAEGLLLYIQNEKILALTDEMLGCDREIDAEGCYVSAGFIDMHVHGGGGYDFMDGGTEPILKAAAFHLHHGTTGILPTTLACSTEVLTEFLCDLREAKQTCKSILGAHLEGPYFSQEQSGAQNPHYIKPPEPAEYNMVLEQSGDLIKRWSFAPELDGSEEFCRALIKHRILPSIGHSNAVLEDVKRVYALGCRFITHLYSGMSTITRQGGFRRLGVVESAYYFDDMGAEIIADARHLPPELLELIIKLKGTEKICLVTDAMRAAGLPDGKSFLGKRGEETPCIIEDGVAKLEDRSAFAGSVATADRLVREMVRHADVSVWEAVKMITANPARILGLQGKGSLKEGYDADLVIFDDEIQINTVIQDGTVVE